MTRVKNGVTTKARHKKVLKAAKGYFGSKHRLYKTAKEQLMHSGQYAYRDRKQKKRDFRKLWIVRINAACRENEISYSRFIEGLSYAGIEVNRKMLSQVAIEDEKVFAEMVKVAKKALEKKSSGEKFVNPDSLSKEKKTVKKETTAKEEDNNAEEKKDLSKMTVAKLKEEAAQRNITIPSGAKKQEILDLLK